MQATPTFELFRPFLWLAVIAFLVGFVGSLALGGGATAVAAGLQRAQPAAAVSGPASDEWNLPKRI